MVNRFSQSLAKKRDAKTPASSSRRGGVQLKFDFMVPSEDETTAQLYASSLSPDRGEGADGQIFLPDLPPLEDPETLRDFLLRLNTELTEADCPQRTNAAARSQFLWLLEQKPSLTLGAVRELFEQVELHYQDPLIQLIFAAARRKSFLLCFLSQMIQREKALLKFRIRAVEGLFMRGTEKQPPRRVDSGAEGALRFLNRLCHALEQPSMDIQRMRGTLVEDFRSVRSVMTKIVKSGSLEESRYEILQSLEPAWQTLATAPTGSKSLELLQIILRANVPLPLWHPVAGSSHGDPGNLYSDGRATLALLIDKTIEIILSMASFAWGPTDGYRGDLEGQRINPCDASFLGTVVKDSAYAPRVRIMAAALLRLLVGATAAKLAPQAEIYTDLFLHGADPQPDPPLDSHQASPINTQEKVSLLLDALDEKTDCARWMAANACLRAARDHPECFQPKHYAKLLPLLSDDHRETRAAVMRTFRALASSRKQEIAEALRGISKNITENLNRTESSELSRRGLEQDLEVILGSLIDRVDKLQGEVVTLSERRKQLLDHIEKQAMRVGEEIHHEVLNTLCGHLATAIDEKDFEAAQIRLEILVAELRRIMNNLYPRDLETQGFFATIRKRLEDVRDQVRKHRRDFRVRFDYPVKMSDEQIAGYLTGPAQLVLLYRIVLEALINARKHSEASYLAVRVYQPGANLLEIKVSDNGRGQGGPFENNVGLSLMFRRAQDIGAEIEFQRTSPKGGTTVRIRLRKTAPAASEIPSPQMSKSSMSFV